MGARHKQKEADKADKRAMSNSGLSGDEANNKGKTGKESGQKAAEDKGKKSKGKKILRDANGESVKRPLSAYMLLNNFRRPVLQLEHPGKSNLQ